MTDVDKEFEGVNITESERPDIERGDDLQTQLGTPDRGKPVDAARLYEQDQLRSVRALEE